MENKTYEQSVMRLEEIVKLLEDENTPLDSAMELFKEGMAISKYCHDKLSVIEKEIMMLTSDKEGEAYDNDWRN